MRMVSVKTSRQGLVAIEGAIAFCQALGLDADEVAHYLREDWGSAPDVTIFHGRQQELETLEEWIVVARCRLIKIIGFAGIVKTSLVRGGIGQTDLSGAACSSNSRRF